MIQKLPPALVLNLPKQALAPAFPLRIAVAASPRRISPAFLNPSFTTKAFSPGAVPDSVSPWVYELAKK